MKSIGQSAYITIALTGYVSDFIYSLADHLTQKLEIAFHGDLLAAQDFTLYLIGVVLVLMALCWKHEMARSTK